MKNVNLKEIDELLYNAAKKFVSEEEAMYFAKYQLSTHIRKSHKFSSLKNAISDLEQSTGPIDDPKIEVDKKASVVVDLKGIMPSLKLKYFHDLLEKRAKEFGIAFVGVKNGGSFHTLNLWTEGLADRNLTGICLYNGGQGCVVPYGGTKGLFGTNPMSYAIPTANEPILADFASSDISFLELRNSFKQNIQLKQNSAVDINGELTTDPKKVYALDEMNEEISTLLSLGGGYKGYEIIMLIELLTGPLLGTLLCSEKVNGDIPTEYGGILIAIDITSFTDIDKFKSSVSKFADVIRSQQPAKWADKVTVPGDRSHETLKDAIQSGTVEIDDAIYDRLKKVAK